MIVMYFNLFIEYDCYVCVIVMKEVVSVVIIIGEYEM